MKALITTLFLILLGMRPQAQAQCGATPHHNNPPFLIVPDTVNDWQQLPTQCFGDTLCTDPAETFDELVGFAITPSLNGWFGIITTRHDSSARSKIVVLNAFCDTILARKCLNYPTDTIQFYNANGIFELWFQTDSNSESITYMGWRPTGSQVMPHPSIECDQTLATTPKATTPTTYRKFDLYTGATGPETTTQPAGLSIRSDGTKCYRVWQIAASPPTSTIVLVFAALALVVICLKSWFPEKTE